MNNDRLIPRLAGVFVSSASAYFALCVIGRVLSDAWAPSAASFLIIGFVSFVANRLLMLRDHMLWHTALLNALLTAGGTVLAFSMGYVPTSQPVFLFILSVCFVVGYAWYLNHFPITLDRAAMVFQGSILCLVIYIWIASLSTVYMSDLLWMLGICLACLIGMLSFKLSGAVHRKMPLGPAGIIAICIAALLICGAAFMLTSAAAEVGKAILGAFSVLGSVLAWCFSLILRFLAWFEETFGAHDPSQEYVRPEAPDFVLNAEEMPSGDPTLVLVMIAALLVGVCLFGLYHLFRLLSQKKTAVPSVQKQSVRRSRFSVSRFISSFFAAVRRKLALWRVLFFHRNTPVGLYLRLTRAARLSRHSLKRGETPYSFLSRLAQLSRELEDSTTAESIASLAMAVDLACYGPTPGFGEKFPNGAALFRKSTAQIRRTRFSLNKSSAAGE